MVHSRRVAVVSASDPRVFKCSTCGFTYRHTNAMRFSEIAHNCAGTMRPLVEQPKEGVG